MIGYMVGNCGTPLIITALFAGFGATALRDVPYAGIYVALYEQSRSLWDTAASPSHSSRISKNFACAALSGFAATCVTQVHLKGF
jgi:solute carrier family 25 protein 38